MQRAGVFIGVNHTGKLAPLRDAAAAAERMAAWAQSQQEDGFIATELITDWKSKVAPEQISDAILRIIEGPPIDQLIVYFAGHGVNIARNEHWLLSDAPRRTSAAVSVSGSVELARYCGIPHVVLISDACRVAPAGIQAQAVRGVDVFPNDGGDSLAKPVDQFYACLLGRTAAETVDPASAAREFRAVYTTELLEALSGLRPEVLHAGAANDIYCYVRPRRLSAFLQVAVPRRILSLGFQHRVNQTPDAIITASDDNWLARHRHSQVAMRGHQSAAIYESPGASQQALDVADQIRRSGGGDLGKRAALAQTSIDQWHREAYAISLQRGAPSGGEIMSDSAIWVRGATITSAFAPAASSVGTDHRGMRLVVETPERRACSVLVRFGEGFGAVVPAIPGCVVTLTFEEQELVDLVCTPSSRTTDWHPQSVIPRKLLGLRAVAAVAYGHGRFRLDRRLASELTAELERAKAVDPTLAIHAAYAYYDLEDLSSIRTMSGLLRRSIGSDLFDLAMLGRELVDRSVQVEDNIVPFIPLLTQGWALLKAHRVKLHPALAEIATTLCESPWSLFEPKGVALLELVMAGGDVR